MFEFKLIVINLTGSKSCDVISRVFSGTLTATAGPVKLYINVKITDKNYDKVLYQSGTLSKNF